ncbi:hypothetical protein BASA81_002210 [Batrachochytrium salamandrivorans]|nr:hypothetical protein BASA81_002210 [Batrachochytrium salamandrivorans]
MAATTAETEQVLPASPPSYELLNLLRKGKRNEALLLAAHTSLDEINANWDGSTPLLVATTRGWGDVCLALLTAGASPNHTSNMGETPLMRAIKSGKIDPLLIHLLLEHYTLDINLQCTEEAFFAKWSALHFACECEMNPHAEIVALLVLRGADLELKNAQGQTALEVLNCSETGADLELFRLALTSPREVLQRSSNAAHFCSEVISQTKPLGGGSGGLLMSNGSFLGRLIGLTARSVTDAHSDEGDMTEEYDDVRTVVATSTSTKSLRNSNVFSSLFHSSPSSPSPMPNEDYTIGNGRKSKTGSFILKMMPGKKSSAIIESKPALIGTGLMNEETGGDLGALDEVCLQTVAEQVKPLVFDPPLPSSRNDDDATILPPV